jgi:hypothetical protein
MTLTLPERHFFGIAFPGSTRLPAPNSTAPRSADRYQGTLTYALGAGGGSSIGAGGGSDRGIGIGDGGSVNGGRVGSGGGIGGVPDGGFGFGL